MLFNYGATPSDAEPFSGGPVIEGVKIPKLQSGGALTYTGSAQSPDWIDFDTTKVTLVSGGSGTNVGTYTAIFRISDTTKYMWEDQSTGDKEIEWYIGKQVIAAVPYQIGNLTYSGTTQSPTWNNYNTVLLTISGVTSAIDAGDYIAQFTPTANAEWWDGSTTAKSASWSMSKAVISTVPSQNGTLSYTGSSITPEWNNYNSSWMTIGGDTSGVNVGSYTATFTPTKNYVWTDGSQSEKNVTWSISKASVAIPTISGTYTYTGSEITPTLNYDQNKVSVSGDTTATNSGTYSITFTLKDIENNEWSDKTTDTKTLNWTISKATVALPTVTGTYTYTGSTITPTTSYDTNKVMLSGDTSAINAGTYTITFTLKDTSNYLWADGTINSKNINWSINKATISVPTLSDSSFTYTGSTITPTFIGYDSNKMIMGADISATEAGNYTTTFTPKPNYQWVDGTTIAKSVSWSITMIVISVVPSQSGTLTYTGNVLTPVWANYDSNQLTIGGETSSTNAGTYIATFTPKTGYSWSDGSTATKNISWTIGKATYNITIEPTSLELTSDNKEQIISVSVFSGGMPTVTSSDESIATVANYGVNIPLDPEGTKFRYQVTGVSTGNCTIHIKIEGNDNYADFSADLPVVADISSDGLPAGYTKVDTITLRSSNYIGGLTMSTSGSLVLQIKIASYTAGYIYYGKDSSRYISLQRTSSGLKASNGQGVENIGVSGSLSTSNYVTVKKSGSYVYIDSTSSSVSAGNPQSISTTDFRIGKPPSGSGLGMTINYVSINNVEHILCTNSNGVQGIFNKNKNLFYPVN